jgi:hypothetical protein
MNRKKLEKNLIENGIYPDRLIAHKDGTYTLKTSFFYRGNDSAEKLANKVRESTPGVNIMKFYDDWQEWPKTSYYVIKFELK